MSTHNASLWDLLLVSNVVRCSRTCGVIDVSKSGSSGIIKSSFPKIFFAQSPRFLVELLF